jgi:hypothetical protein
MSATDFAEAKPFSPLEEFFRDYVETIGGDWDEIEPQVYDLLLPTEEEPTLLAATAHGTLRIAFDPEALPEHAGAQLASFGTPLVDHLLDDAIRRGRFTQLYVVGLNLTPHDLPARLRRGLTLPARQRLEVERIRPLYFSQAVYYFQASFVSDQKEQEIVPVGLDLHYGRQVRHLEQLLEHSKLSEHPAQALAQARRLSLVAGLPVAREQVIRTVAALANTRTRELDERLSRQIARMTRYYSDLRQELEDQARRARVKDDDADRFATRRAALEREQQLRVAELQQKSSLRIELRLLSLQVIDQPKLLLRAQVLADKAAAPLELVWDPLTDALEAPACPSCGRPGFTFEVSRLGKVICPACPPEQKRHGGKGL